jgi:integrase
MPKLTKRVLDAAEIRTTPYFLWCSDLKGFGVRVFPSGRRVYYADFRTIAGARRRMSLGEHGKLTVDEARRLAITTLGDVIRGDDPVEERVTRRKSLTVSELCRRYLEAAEAGLVLGRGRKPKKATTLVSDRGRIEHHIIPLLGARLVRDLTTAEVQRFVRDVQAGRTSKRYKTKARGIVLVEGGAGAASRTVGLLGGIMSYAIGEGIITLNPVRGVRRPADRKKDRRLTPEEYSALGRVLAEAEERRESWQAMDSIRLLCLTGCRMREVANLRWTEVDFAGCCLRLDDTKEGRSIRPLGQPAVALLRRLEEHRTGPYVLPATRGEGGFGGIPDAIERYAERGDLKGVGAHTLRHSFASTAADLGYSDSTIAAMLGHAGHGVTSRYIHHLDTVLLAAADRVAEQIESILGTSAQASPSFLISDRCRELGSRSNSSSL